MKVLRTVLILLVAVALGVLGAQWLSHQNSYDLGNVVVSVGGNDYRAAMPQARSAKVMITPPCTRPRRL